MEINDEEVRSYEETPEAGAPVSAEAIARLAGQGEDISRFFKGQGRYPTHRDHKSGK
jgi:hypothetical protein